MQIKFKAQCVKEIDIQARAGPKAFTVYILDCSNPKQPTAAARISKHGKLWEESQCWQPGTPLHTGPYFLFYVIPMGFQWVLQFTTAAPYPEWFCPLKEHQVMSGVMHFWVSYRIGTELWALVEYCWPFSIIQLGIHKRQSITNKTDVCKIEQVSRSKLHTQWNTPECPQL